MRSEKERGREGKGGERGDEKREGGEGEGVRTDTPR